MAKVEGGLVDYRGGCWDCNPEGLCVWAARNVMGVAAQHSDRYGHRTWVELGSSFVLTPTKGGGA